MNIRFLRKKKLVNSLSIVFSAALLSACSSGSDTASIEGKTASIVGTVPGTKIEAFADNGAYYSVHSTDDGTTKHPFELVVPAGMGLRVVMTTNEGTSDEVVSPIGFRNNTMQVQTRMMLGSGDVIDMGHVPLAMSHAEAAGDVDGDGDNDDINNDGMLDSPFMLDDAHSPLAHADADHDGLNDFDDPDHGGYMYSSAEKDPLDHDGDGVPNMYDMDYRAGTDFIDKDKDGLNDVTDDANPGNMDGMNAGFIDDLNGDGYHDDDKNHDGFHDDDSDFDGYHDDDMDRDGFCDKDLDKDGFADDDLDKDGHDENDHAMTR